MIPHQLLILAILRVAIFSIEVPERDLSEEQYALEAAAENAYCFELNSLSGTEVLKMATQSIARIETTCGGFHFMFFIYSTW